MKLNKDQVEQLKSKLLWEKIMCPYKWKSKFEQQVLLKQETHKDIDWGSKIIPKLICDIGGYGYRDEPGRDAQDNSEIKVIGVHPLTGRCDISNLRTKNGKKKIGDLRIVIANMMTREVISCYIPKNNWYLWELSNNGHNVGRINITFKKKKQTMNINSSMTKYGYGAKSM